MRNVAIVAFGRLMVARLRPRLVLIPHDMTIHACARIITEIRQALGIIKGIKSETGHNPQRQTGKNLNLGKRT